MQKKKKVILAKTHELHATSRIWLYGLETLSISREMIQNKDTKAKTHFLCKKNYENVSLAEKERTFAMSRILLLGPKPCLEAVIWCKTKKLEQKHIFMLKTNKKHEFNKNARTRSMSRI